MNVMERKKTKGHAVLFANLNINNKAQRPDVIDTVACVQPIEDTEENLLGGSSASVQVEQLMHGLATPSQLTPSQTPNFPDTPAEAPNLSVSPPGASDETGAALQQDAEPK
eukprot:2540842-Rhodomonas_salina.2